MFPEGLEPSDDLTSAGWVESALKDWPDRPLQVRNLVPPAFEAYARILHRTRNEDRDRMRSGTWAQWAAQLGRELGPETTWWNLLGSAPYEGARDPWTPEEGGLSGSEVGTLISFLGPMTSDPAACWFALWAGWGLLGEKGQPQYPGEETKPAFRCIDRGRGTIHLRWAVPVADALVAERPVLVRAHGDRWDEYLWGVPGS